MLRERSWLAWVFPCFRQCPAPWLQEAVVEILPHFVAFSCGPPHFAFQGLVPRLQSRRAVFLERHSPRPRLLGFIIPFQFLPQVWKLLPQLLSINLLVVHQELPLPGFEVPFLSFQTLKKSAALHFLTFIRPRAGADVRVIEQP